MTHLHWLVVIGVGIVAVATLLRFVPDPGRSRARLRRSVILVVPYVFLAGLLWLAPRWLSGAWLAGVTIAADFLALLIGVNLALQIVFDIGFKLVRLRVPDIMHEVSLGAAYVISMVWLMHRSGVNITSIVATSAVATAVIGLSLQSTLGSVIGGLTLQLDNSINEGDWIELENKTQGKVRKIRWRYTIIETRDWDTIIVPNAQLLNQSIKILGKIEGRPLQHRMWVHFNVDFRTPPSDVIRVVDKALNTAIPGVASEPKPNTVCLDLARERRDSFAYYATRYWLTDLQRDDPTSSAVRERIFSALQRAQIPLALPAATLFVSEESDARGQRKAREFQRRILDGLRSVSLFKSLSDTEMQELANSVKVAPFVAGEIVTRQGAQANWLYVLVQGQVEIRIATDGGESKRVNTLVAPDFFGEMALVAGSPREATVIAVDDIQCLRVEQSAFRNLLAQRPEIAREVAEALAERRVALDAAREDLDAEARSRRVAGERHRILRAVQQFFGLSD
jgi:CRP-like cAMP-binding protein/small-conductance mechanosensitive channel